MLVNVCLDDIFWTVEHFVTKFGIVMQCHKPKLSYRLFFFFYSLQGQGHSKGSCDQNMTFYYIFRTADSLAIKLGLMTYHHKPECLVKEVGTLHSRSRSQQSVKISMFVQMVSSKPQNILLPNLVWWCIIVRLSVMQKDWFAIFKVKVSARAHMIKIWQFLLSFWTADSFAARLALIAHYH